MIGFSPAGLSSGKTEGKVLDLLSLGSGAVQVS